MSSDEEERERELYRRCLDEALGVLHDASNDLDREGCEAMPSDDGEAERRRINEKLAGIDNDLAEISRTLDDMRDFVKEEKRRLKESVESTLRFVVITALIVGGTLIGAAFALFLR